MSSPRGRSLPASRARVRRANVRRPNGLGPHVPAASTAARRGAAALGSRSRRARAAAAPASRRGAVLVLVVLLCFGLFALASAVLEVGAARVSQARLASAVDPAAREALRLRDVDGDQAEFARRAAARDLVRRAFDADLDLGTADRGLDPHAGGVVPTADLFGVGGAGGFDPAAIGTWEPAPELNRTNAPFGDLVAGTYLPAAAGAPEGSDYARADFAPSDAAQAGEARAFLVRTRRTPPDAPLDRVAGVSSAGPPLPRLFGLATTAQAAPGATYDPRRDGLAIRATTIADARPALTATVGAPGAGLLEWGGRAPGPAVDGGRVAPSPAPALGGAGAGVGRGPAGSASGRAVAGAVDGALFPNAPARVQDGPRSVLALDAAGFAALAVDTQVLLEARPEGVFAAGTEQRVGWLLPTGGQVTVGDLFTPTAAPGTLDPDDALASDGVRAVVLGRAEGPTAVRAVAFGGLEIESVAVVPERAALLLTGRVAPATVAAGHASVHAPSAWLALEPGGPLEVPGLAVDLAALEHVLLAPVVVR